MRKSFGQKDFQWAFFYQRQCFGCRRWQNFGNAKGIDTGKDEIIDRRDFILSPGFVDKHTHGIGGVDF